MKAQPLPLTNNIDMASEENSAGVLNLFACKCPRCRRGDMFEDKNPWHLKRTMRMNKECPVCGQPFNIEVGFYYGSGYASYGLTVLFSIISFVAWWLSIGFSINDNRINYWLVINAFLLIVLQPYFMRLARTAWLALFVRYDKHWKINPPKPLERTNEGQEGNW